MNSYYYDFHLHSCLSPCGDNDNTPYNLAGMAAVKGLQVIALTDHNTCGNCPAFFKACKTHGIIPVAGMELTTAEDIHMVCLFEQLDEAMAFDKAVASHRMRIPNREDIFGEQLLMDHEDGILGKEEHLLTPATTLSLEEAFGLVKEYNGVCYPAHIDRTSNGILATLGFFPEEPNFSLVEYKDAAKRAELESKFPLLKDKGFVASSDAHFLWDMNEPEHCFTVEDEPYSSAKVRSEIFKLLRGGTV